VYPNPISMPDCGDELADSVTIFEERIDDRLDEMKNSYHRWKAWRRRDTDDEGVLGKIP
jgi:hypothetical protein